MPLTMIPEEKWMEAEAEARRVAGDDNIEEMINGLRDMHARAKALTEKLATMSFRYAVVTEGIGRREKTRDELAVHLTNIAALSGITERDARMLIRDFEESLAEGAGHRRVTHYGGVHYEVWLSEAFPA